MSNPDGTATDPEALGEEREEYPDPESYPPAEIPQAEVTDGAAPDPDITAGDAEGQT